MARRKLAEQRPPAVPGVRNQDVFVALQDGTGTGQRIHGTLAGDGAVECRAQRINTRPRTPLVAVAGETGNTRAAHTENALDLEPVELVSDG